MSYCDPKIRVEDNSTEVVLDGSTSIFTDYKTAKYHKLTDFIVGEIFRKYADQLGWTPSNLTKAVNIQKLTKGIYQYFDNMLTENANEIEGSIFLNISDESYDDIENNILPNFEQFMSHYYEFGSITSIKDFELDEDFFDRDYNDEAEAGANPGDVSDDEIEDNKGKDYDKIGNELSQIELATKEIKVLFKLVPKAVWNEAKQTSEVFLDSDGLPTTADFGPVFNLLLDRMSNTKDYEAFKSKLKSIDTLRVIPEAQYLGELLKLDKDNTTISPSELRLFISFYQIFSKPKIQIQSALKQANGNSLVIDEVPGNLRSIRQSYISNFQMANVNPNVKQFLTKNDIEAYYLDITNFPEKPETYNEKIDFLSLIGVKLTGLEFLDTDSKQEMFENMLNETTDYLYTSVYNRLRAGEVLREPTEQLRKQFTSEDRLRIVKSETASLDRIIEFESRYSKIVPSLSSRNSEGELQYLISLDNQLSITTYHLNNSRTLDELYTTSTFINAKYNPLFEKSYFIKFLFDTNGNKIEGRTVQLSNLSGFKKQEGKRTTSKLERKLSAKDKLIQDFNMMLLDGMTDVMRTETSNSFFTISLKDQGKNRPYYPANAFITDFKSNSGFKTLIFNYLKAEIERIKSYNNKKQENPTLPASYGKFSIFYSILETGNPIKSRLLSESFDKDSALFDNFLDIYQQYLTNEVNNFKQELDTLGISYDDLISPNLRSAGLNASLSNDAFIRSFVANTLVQNIEFSIMYSGDPLFVKDFHKRLKGLSSTGDLAAILSILKDFKNSSYEQSFHDRFSLAGAMNVSQRDNDNNFQTQTIYEHKQKADFAYTQPSMVESIRQSIIKRDRVNEQFTEEYIKNEVLSDANNQKPADGEGYITLDFHRELSYRFGFNNEDMETVYKYEGLIFRKDILEQELSKTDSDELAKLELEIYRHPEKYATPVIKMTYYGNIENSTIDAKAYDKFSTAPLLPSDARNNPILKKLLIDMVSSQVGYVKYESGTKLFATTPINIDNIKSATHDLYKTELLKLQIKPKSKQKSKTSIPTQMLKLIFSNLFNNGVATNNTVKELYDRYINVLQGIQKVQTEELLKDLGITDEGIDMKTLSKKLISQAKAQGLNSNVISALEIGADRSKGVLEESGFVEQIINLVSGIGDKRLRRFELAGGDFVLVTNANRGKLKFYEYTENGTTACECRISMNKEHVKLLNKIHPDGEPIGDIRRLNALLGDPTWVKKYEKELTIVLDRVPTQGPNSMDYAVVREFLTPTIGNVIILPDEIVYKSGTDFDYDKEKVLIPMLSPQGDYINDETLPRIKAEIGELENQYSQLRDFVEDEDNDAVDILVNKIFNNSLSDNANLAVTETLEQIEDKIRNYLSLKRAEFGKLNNDVIDVYSKVLALPEMFAELVIPNSTRTLKPLAEKNSQNAGTSATLPKNDRVFSYLENLKVFKTYFDAKNMLGPFAVDNTFMQLLQYQGIDINDKYSRYGNPKNSRTINNMLLDDYEIDKIKKGEQYRTSLKDDLDGYIKQHWDSEAINATVDAAKDPWFALLRINYQNIGVVNFMKNLGYPIERVVDFINLPILQEFFVLQQNGMSKNKAIQQIAGKLGLYSVVKADALVPNMLYEQMKTDDSINIVSATKKDANNYIVKTEQRKGIPVFTLINIFKNIDERKKLKSDYKDISDKLTYAPIKEEELKSRVKDQIYSDDFNIRAFAHFIMTDQHNQAFRNFQYYFNFDTTKMATPTDIREKENLRQTIIDEKMFSFESIQAMENDSIMSSFVNTKVLKSIFDGLFPIIGRSDVQDTMNDLYKSYKMNFRIRNKNDMRRMPKVLNNDLITSILFNFNLQDGETFIKRNKSLLIREEGKKTMADHFEDLRNEEFYNKLVQQFPVLEQMIVTKHRINFLNDMNGLKQYSFIENIQLLRPSSETPVEAESTIDQFKTLSSYTVKDYSEDKNIEYTKKLQDFTRNLFLTGLVQSGMSQSRIGYSDYIPTEFKKVLFSNALENFRNIPEEEFQNFLAAFKSQFTYNNPKYFPDVYTNGSVFNNQNNYSTLFKNYDITLDFVMSSMESEEDEGEDVNEVNNEVVEKYPSITEISRSHKKETFNVALSEGGTEEKMGYRVIIPQYPSFEGFLNNDYGSWTITEKSTGKSMSIKEDTIKEALDSLKTILNKNMTSPIMREIGFIEPIDLPPTKPKC